MTKLKNRPETVRGRLLDKIYNIVTLGGRIPCVVLIIYTIVGGLLFQYLERAEDEARRKKYAEVSEWAVNQMLRRMLEIKCQDIRLRNNTEEQVVKVKSALYWFFDHLNLTEIIAARSEESPWTLLGGMFYAGQLYTTIGYGIPTTQTREGQMTSIFYILFGIPLFLVALKQVGQSLSTTLKRAYRSVRRHKKHHKKTGDDAENGKDSMDAQEKEKRKAATKLTTMLTQIPIAFAILLGWILISSFLLCCWETHWGLTTSIYFYFVSISTVGLGDIIPSNQDMLVVNFLLILIGLAILSMSLNLLQTLIENLWSLLIREYLCEMEVMAQEGKADGRDEEATTFELGLLGKLMRIPAVEHGSRGMMAVAKSWMAEKVAIEVIERELESDPDSDESSSSSDERDEEPEGESRDELKELHSVEVQADSPNSPRRHPPLIERQHSRESRESVRMFRESRVMKNKALFNKIQTLEKLRPHRNDFKSMVFSKFLANERLQKLVEDNERSTRKRSTAVQTDGVDLYGGIVKRRPGSMISTASSSTGSFIMDEEKYLLLGYDDIKIGEYAQDENSPLHVVLQQYLDEFREKRRSRLIRSRPSSIQEIDDEPVWIPQQRTGTESISPLAHQYSTTRGGGGTMSEQTSPVHHSLLSTVREYSSTPTSPLHLSSASGAMLDSGYGREGETSVSETPAIGPEESQVEGTSLIPPAKSIPVIEIDEPEVEEPSSPPLSPTNTTRIQWGRSLRRAEEGE